MWASRLTLACRRTLASSAGESGAVARNAVAKGAGSRPAASERSERMVYCTPAHKFVLASSFSYWPHQVPSHVSQAALNQAFSRFRIISATITMFIMLYIADSAMTYGRKARDGGDDCLYDTPAARAVQERKRVFQAELARMEAEHAELQRAKESR